MINEQLKDVFQFLIGTLKTHQVQHTSAFLKNQFLRKFIKKYKKSILARHFPIN